MRQNWKRLLRRAGSAVLALLLLVTAAGIAPAARAADALESPVIVKNSDGTYDVTFQYNGTVVTEPVEIRGTVPGSDWGSGIAMTENGGVWSAALDNLSGGTYEYKFYTGEADWPTDPGNPVKSAGGNSLLVLDEKPVVTDNGDGTYNVTLRYADVDGTAASVEVMGNGGLPGTTWSIGGSVAMEKTAEESNIWWAVFENVEPASCEYKFVLNGSDWIEDPANPSESGGNSALQVGSKAPDEPVTFDPEVDVVVMIHYSRPDGEYDGWDAYTWVEGVSSAGNVFFPEDGGVVATVVVPEGVTRLGFIIRYGGDSWKDKDVQDDRFIEIPEMISGIVHIYAESGVKAFTKVYDETAKYEHKPVRASYNGDGTLTVVMSGKIEDDLDSAFTLPDSGITVTAVSEGKEAEDLTWTYILTLSGELEAGGVYRLAYQDGVYEIKMPNIYSTEAFEAKYTYTGSDLGATWTAEKTAFRVWAPTAQSVAVNLYESGTEGTDDLIKTVPMTADVNGTWVAEVEGDLNGVYYTYTAEVGIGTVETVDPYARTTGVNGKRAMVIDLASTNPAGWDEDVNPNAGLSYTDAIIYELHVRDLSSDGSSGIRNTGKFLGLIETGTATENGVPTGLDHIKDLGITHLHLLPSYDYGSVDETRLDEAQFNWGYDPVNYNVPEGSYSTDPYNGAVRVAEMKEMVKGLHDNGISVVMDVVYNHVQDASSFSINRLVPGYFSRIDDNGVYSNGSGCGNDTASERSMVRKFIVDSVNYWADEYHIDGFRFDLVGLLDTETVNEIVSTVHETHPDVIFYGEGWTMGTAVTKEGVTMATQKNAALTPGFAYFNDSIRDGIKGSVFTKDPGYVSGASGLEDAITQTFMGLTDDSNWSCPSPAQTVNYASCHDNNTLMDRLALSRPDASREELIRMNNLAAAIYLTAEGIPFLQAGEEMLRTKPNEDGSLNENSYNSPDSVNSLKWDTLENEEYWDVYEYYKGLIAFRKAHGALRLASAEDVLANVTPVDGLPENVVAFEISGGVNGETADALFVVFNANSAEQEIALPAGTWNVYINGEKAGTEVLESVTGGTAVVAPISALVLVRELPYSDVEDGAWYRDAVAFVTDAGLMVGTRTDTFAPDGTATRGMIAAILYRMAGEPGVAEPSGFSDVPGSAYYADAVAWAAANGIAQGYSGNTFGPKKAVTRQELAVMLWRMAGEPSATVTLDSWPDAGDVSGYAGTAMAWCVENGIINGSGGKLNPQGAAVRAQVAAMVMRFCENTAG